MRAWAGLAMLGMLPSCGTSKDTRLVDLTPEELARACKDLGGAQTFLCEEDGIYVQFTVGEDCEGRHASLSGDCPATLDDLKTCDQERRKAYEEDPCRTDAPDSCGVVDSCLLDVD